MEGRPAEVDAVGEVWIGIEAGGGDVGCGYTELDEGSLLVLV